MASQRVFRQPSVLSRTPVPWRAGRSKPGVRRADAFSILLSYTLSLISLSSPLQGTTIARLMAFVTPDRFPAVIESLRAEQAAVAASHGPELTPAAIAAMPYLDAVIKETNRLFPIVSGVFRKALADLAVCGYRVPAGERVMLMLGQTQNQIEEFAGDLADFKPERWLPLRKDPAAWMPFGAGPHVCLGMGLALSEIKVVLATLVRDYEWAPVDPEAAASWRAPLQPVDGVPAQVWRRGAARPPVVAIAKASDTKGADAWWVTA